MDEPEREPAAAPEEEDEAIEKDREAGRQLGTVLLVLGVGYALAGALLFESFSAIEAGIAAGVIVVGFVTRRWPLSVVRLFTGMGDKV